MARIPRTIAEFFSYLERTDNYLQLVIVPTNGTRLGMSITNVAKWHTNAGNGAALYLQYKDPLQTGPSVKTKVKKLMTDFFAFAQPQLDIIAASENATTDDAEVFNVVLVRKKPTHKTEKIKNKCYATSESMGGCRYTFRCRTLTDAKRASLAPGSDSVEIAYLIGDKDTKVPTADEMVLRQAFSKAMFIKELGTINSQKVLYIYFRWTNSKHPELASSWSDLMIIPIV